MMPQLALVLVLPATASSPAPAGPTARAEDPDPDRLVQVELVADVASVAPGARFRLGLRFELAPQWHVYWENPGDSGLATRARVAAPPGFEVGPARFPGPERFELPGGLTSYGYEGELVLLFEVSAPAELPAGELAFRAEADWLVCKEACHLGSGAAELALAAARPGAAPASSRAELFARWERRLPRPLAELRGAEARWAATSERAAPELVLRIPSAAEGLEFFPAPDERLWLVEREVVRDGDASALRVRYEFDPDDEHDRPVARGLLRVGRGAEAVFHRVELAWPAEGEPPPESSR